MRVSLCLASVLCASSGCFLDHGAPGDEREMGGGVTAVPPAPYEGVCSLSAAAVYPKALTFYRTADCHEPTLVDRCAVEGPEWPTDGAPALTVTTERVSMRAEDDTLACGAAPILAPSLSCDLPIEGVGDYDVLIDGEDALHLTIPYDSPMGASCWTFGGRCETGAGPALDLPDAIGAGQAFAFEVAELYGLDTPLPDGCIVRVEDGGTMGPLDTPRIHVEIDLGDAAPGEGCVGIGRRTACLMPPLSPGSYEVSFSAFGEASVRSLEVR